MCVYIHIYREREIYTHMYMLSYSLDFTSWCRTLECRTKPMSPCVCLKAAESAALRVGGILVYLPPAVCNTDSHCENTILVIEILTLSITDSYIESAQYIGIYLRYTDKPPSVSSWSHPRRATN